MRLLGAIRRLFAKKTAPVVLPELTSAPEVILGLVSAPEPLSQNVRLVEFDEEEIVEIGSNGRVYKQDFASRGQRTVLRDPRGEY